MPLPAHRIGVGRARWWSVGPASAFLAGYGVAPERDRVWRPDCARQDSHAVWSDIYRRSRCAGSSARRIWTRGRGHHSWLPRWHAASARDQTVASDLAVDDRVARIPGG